MMDDQRAARYERIHEQLRGLIENKSPTLVAAMSTMCAVLHAKMPHHSWTGFYFATDDNELYVGPYQGPVACQILKDTGVCLHAVKTRQPVVVADVHAFPGHIACDSRSQSEIVLPLFKEDRVIAVLDIDSTKREQFTDSDIRPLNKILELLDPYL